MHRSFALVSAMVVVACTGTPEEPSDPGPALLSATLSPDAPTVFDPIEITVLGAEGVNIDDLSLAITWYVDDEEVSNEDTLAAGTARFDQTVHATVTTVAERNTTSPVTSNSVVIANSPPELVSVVLSPDPVFTEDVVSVDIEGTDPDAHALTVVSYEWFVNELSLGVGSEAELMGIEEFSRDDSLRVSVVLTDGYASIEGSSDSLIVSDTPSEAPEIDIENGETHPSDDIFCEVLVAATDLDSVLAPAYDFTWQRDGVPYTGTLLTTVYEGDTVPNSATTARETWTCEVTALVDETETFATATTDIANLRPRDAPDWRIFAISGHCADCPNELNVEYLDTDSDDTLSRLQNAMEDYGYTVEAFAYADEFYNRDASLNTYLPDGHITGHDGPEPSGVGYPDRWGFLQIVNDMEYIRDHWQADFDDPTRVIFVAHSHGVVWSHQAFRTVTDLDIELAIDFDGYSMVWEEEAWPLTYGDNWSDRISEYNDAYGTSFHTQASSDWYVIGVGFEDVEDVLPQTNVTYCLEVQASSEWNMSAGWVNDDDDNHRPDGSTTGITTYYASSQDHSVVATPDGEGMEWVLDQLEAMYGDGE